MPEDKPKVRRVTVPTPVVNGTTRMRIGRAFVREDGTIDVFLDVHDKFNSFKIEVE